MSNKHGSTGVEQHHVINKSTPSGTDVKLGTIWTDPDDGSIWVCTQENPVVFTQLNHTRSHDLEGGSDHTTSSGVDGHILKQTGATTFVFEVENYSINFIIDGGGSAITTGVKGYVMIETPGVIEQATTLADQSGSIVIDIWKDTYANYPPVDADSITASAPPTITAATKAQDATLTGWTTTLSAGDILGFNVDSITTVQRATLVLKVRKT